MGGPWRERGDDARQGGHPVRRVEARVEAVRGERGERGIVFAYAALVVLSVLFLLVLGRLGW